MEPLQLLLLSGALSLLSAVQAEGPKLIPARSWQLLGDWNIVRWAGNMPIPEKRKAHPLPPFMFAINKLKKLEFRMNIMKPIGCIQFKLPLDEHSEPGLFFTWWRHKIYISLLPGKKHAIASFKDKVDNILHQMMMLMGRTLDEDAEAVKVFVDFVNSTGLKRTDMVHPNHVGACKLPPKS
ncbi:odorant-binding protein 2b-like [Dipodomys merriami]|uniref:odorant-binding protein 2b-like n=1 Tax=Dipodomys merriami TaxID=94247 RepID=UPI00384AB74E